MQAETLYHPSPVTAIAAAVLRFVVIDLAAPRRLGRALATAILAPDFSGRRLHMNIQQGVADLLFGLGR